MRLLDSEDIRREKLDRIFRKVRTRSFVRRARKMGLDIPYAYEVPAYKGDLGYWLSDSITNGWIYDTKEDEEWINAWYLEVFNTNELL